MKTIISFLVVSFLCINISTNAQGWSQLGTGPSALNPIGEGIYTISTDVHGNVYAAGWIYDTSWQQMIAKWNGVAWSNISVPGSAVSSIVNVDQILPDTSGNVYVVGQINDSARDYVAKWDGTAWSQVGSGSAALNGIGDILAICLDRNGNLYAAGVFTDSVSTAGGHCYVAKWDGTSWTELGYGVNALNANSAINTIFADTLGNIYAAGHFTDGASYFSGNLYVAKWDGTTWTELGTGICPQFGGNAQIFSIVPDAVGNIYAAGMYIFEPGTTYGYVAKWDGTAWSEVGTGSSALNANGQISSLCVDINGNLYASGWFTNGPTYATGNPYVAKWDGVSWSELGTGGYSLNANGSISSICSDATGNIYAAGLFTDTTISFVDSFNPTPYHPFYVAKYGTPTTFATSLLHHDNGIKIYPNPAHNFINIGIDKKAASNATTYYSILDCSGKVMCKGKLENSNTTVNIEELAAGVYFLQVSPTNAYKIVKD